MPAIVITPPAAAIDGPTLALHLKLDADTAAADATLLAGYLAAAQQLAQHYAGIAIGAQVLELALDGFPGGAVVALMPGPATGIVSVKYLDEAGVEQTLSPGVYQLDLYKTVPEFGLAHGATWPATRTTVNAVKIRYNAGSAIIDPAVKAALLLTVGHLYEHREAVAPGGQEELPMGAKALLDTVKVWSM